MSSSVIAYIGIGSNIGDKKANCLKAIEYLGECGKVIKASSLYYTEPVGYREQEDFINAVAAVETSLSPEQLLQSCHAIEDKLGRKRTIHWGPRSVDLDILLYGNLVTSDPELVIPHPLMAQRRFVLIPLAEIAADAVHPVFGKKISQLLAEIKDTATVMKCRPDSRSS
jgi:2-amino-4-hydroxy-6-hydroxymethyldihydropteridine diphosphokinase